MPAIRRVTAVVSLALIALVASAAPSAADSFFQPAGNYHITTLRAGYFVFGDGLSQPSLSVNVTDTTTIANPLVGPSSATHETDVFINGCGANGTDFICGGGCFIPDGASDFSLAGDLQSATLNTTVMGTTKPCRNQPVSLPVPFMINVAWTGTGPLGTGTNVRRFNCAGYSSETQTFFAFNPTTATATTSLFKGSFPAFGSQVSTSDERIHTQGVVNDACPPLGLKGAGGPPLAPGEYHFASQTASVYIPGSDFSQPSITVNVVSFTKMSKPTPGTPSTDSETQLTIYSRGFFTFAADCFVLQSPNAFTISSGLGGASVHAVIDENTPVCPLFPNDPTTFPIMVDATWTGSGPLASLRTTNTSNCGPFSGEGSGAESFNSASASGSLSMLPLPGSFTTNQASLDSNDNRLQILGTAPQACNVRA